ncbi:hypothetical protein [Ekhidna sp. To15]|uniref:hypothetical protein n=1 Tax=Ekhidna sp. To15 TaxID=3395267 RepID=UPI003F5237C7
MKLISLTFVLISILVSNCQEEVQSSDIQKITFGTSFGMCAGYCTQTLELSDGQAIKTVIPRVNPELEERSCEKSIELFESISSKINLPDFYLLEETIGCPDCADGGAEWIEITTPNGSKKVTYEFGKEPNSVKSFINDLRKLYDELGECDD